MSTMRKQVTWTITSDTDVPLRDLRKPVAVMVRDGHLAVEVETVKTRWRYVPEMAKRRKGK
jgi:hypothetical protein